MHLKIYDDIKIFHKVTYNILMRHEAQNVIPLGNVIIGNDGKDKTAWRDPVNWFMATVSDSDGVSLIAIMTPPKNLTLYATDNINNESAVKCLIDGVKRRGVHIPGVMAEKTLAEMFAQFYVLSSGVQYKVDTDQRIYELSQVSPGIPTIGNVRLVAEKDMSFLPYWVEGFYYDCFKAPLIVDNDVDKYRYHIATERLYVLENDGLPVTMAKISRELQTTCVIGFVYTPPYFRGNGYATSCVAAVSQIALSKGFAKCVLYTDLANPTSNSIYMKIGYMPICDSLDIKFVPKQ